MAEKKSNYGRGNTAWFTHDRFGMFIHWGLYSMPARHEWVRKNEWISDEDYKIYFECFEPDLFEPEKWAKAARNAGMKYVVFTAKHHEGFCMWDSQYTDYKVTNTPAGKDLLKEIVTAFRAEGLHIGLYYSLLDWHHPDFTLDPNHPMTPHVEADEFNKGRDMRRYAKYMRDQVTELLTNYGKIDILWFDFSYPQIENGKGKDAWESEKLIKLVRKLQPDVIVDNRLDLPQAADVVTPEQFIPAAPVVDESGRKVVWEGCHTFSGSWGYFRDETTWKPVKMCIEMLIDHVSKGGNLLMNVGPTSRGYIDERAMARLEGFGKWMKFNSRAIYGCGQAPAEFPAPENCRYTYNAEKKRLYLHCLSWPFRHIHLPGLSADKVKYIQLLADGSEIRIQQPLNTLHANLMSFTPKNSLTLLLPSTLPFETDVPVIEIFLK